MSDFDIGPEQCGERGPDGRHCQLPADQPHPYHRWETTDIHGNMLLAATWTNTGRTPTPVGEPF